MQLKSTYKPTRLNTLVLILNTIKYLGTYMLYKCVPKYNILAVIDIYYSAKYIYK